MLAFGLKSQLDNISLEKPLNKIIEARGWVDGKTFVRDVSGWRERVGKTRLTEKGGEEARDESLQYYRLATQAAFHFTHQQLVDGKVKAFRWADAFVAKEWAQHADFRWDAINALFNAASAQSYMATMCDRHDGDGLKQACHLFQQAAGTIAEVRGLLKAAAFAQLTPDLGADSLAALEALMLAQAQKCFYEKAMKDGMKPLILAKITADCANKYEDVSQRFKTATVSAGLDAEWASVIEWNRLLFAGLQHYYAADEHLQKNEYGKQVSRLTYATNKCAEAVNACLEASEGLQEQFRKAHAMAAEAQRQARHDNDMIYTEKVPQITELPPIKGHAMVKPIRVDELDVPDPPVLAPPPEVAREPSVPTAVPPPAKPVATPVAPMAALSVGGGEPPPPSFDDATNAGVSQLVAMGFSDAQARDALSKTGGSVQAATELLLG